MSTEVIVALISSPVLVAILGLWADSRRSRRENDRAHAEVLAKVESIRKGQDEIKSDVKEVRAEQNRHAQRLAGVEATLSNHLAEQRRGA